MTTEDILEALIEEGTKAYKKLNRNTKEGKKLTRKEEVEIEGVVFSCWREYTVYKIAEYLRSLLPDVPITVELDGNDTSIQIEVDEKAEQKLNSTLYSFYRELK